MADRDDQGNKAAAKEAQKRARRAEERAEEAEQRAEEAEQRAEKAAKKAKKRKKALKLAEHAAELAEERADRSARKVAKWKRRAQSAQNQVSVLQDLNRQLTVSYREDRAADAAALHFAAEAVAAFAADAVALREITDERDCSEYLDHLTFRLRQNLLEARNFLDEQGEVGRAGDLADLLNVLPPDSTHRRS